MSSAFVLGVTGHRPNRLLIPRSVLMQCLQELLGEIREVLAARCPGSGLVALSALAEGADQVFAEAALRAGCSLQVLLPLQREPYLATFSAPGGRDLFAHLLARAASVQMLAGCADDLPGAFARLGGEIISQSNLVVGIWDGQHAAGPGGTAAVMQQAINAHGLVGCVDATACQAQVRWLNAMWPPAQAAVSAADALARVASNGGVTSRLQHEHQSCSRRAAGNGAGSSQ